MECTKFLEAQGYGIYRSFRLLSITYHGHSIFFERRRSLIDTFRVPTYRHNPGTMFDKCLRCGKPYTGSSSDYHDGFFMKPGI
jgi:hypothetical protein